MAFLKFANSTLIEAKVARRGGGLLKDAHRHVFNYTPREGYLYVRSRAISSRTNDNFDTFPADEIKKAWASFVGKPVFVNHHNDDIRRKRGVIIDAALHEDIAPDGTPDTWVEVLMEIDAVRFPKLAEAILAGDIERTSMGCDVAESECSVCGNVARTPNQYCAHVSRMKGQRIRRRSASTGGAEDVLVHEICRGISFFENSLLVEPPADPTAFFLGVDDRGVRSMGLTKAAKKGKVRDDEYVTLTDAQKERFKGTTVRKDDKGYYCHTHRARGDSYPSVDEIPDDVVEFIESTGAIHNRFSPRPDTWQSNHTLDNLSFERDEDGSYTVNVWGPPDANGFTDLVATIDQFSDSLTVYNPDGSRAKGGPISMPKFTSQADAERWVTEQVKRAWAKTATMTDLDPYVVGYEDGSADARAGREAAPGENERYAKGYIQGYTNALRPKRPVTDFEPYWGTIASRRTAMNQQEADRLLVDLDEKYHRALAKFVPYTVYGPQYSRGITENLMDAIRAALQRDDKAFNYWWSKCEAGYDIEVLGNENNWYYDSAMGQYTKRLASKTALTFRTDRPYEVDYEASLANDATFENGVYRWKSNGQVPPADFLEKANVPADIQRRCKEVRDAETRAFMEEYRRSRENYTPSAEEEAEIRANFDDPYSVVDVITGKPVLKRPGASKTSAWEENRRSRKIAAKLDWEWYERGRIDAEAERPSVFDWGLVVDRSLEESELAQDSYFQGYRDNSTTATKTSSHHHAFGETTVPPKIDTLRLAECPVCGEDANWDGSGRCRTCGYIPPPEPFRDPDLEVAKRVDMSDGWINPELAKAPPFEEPE